jgi:hypothetical protein
MVPHHSSRGDIEQQRRLGVGVARDRHFAGREQRLEREAIIDREDHRRDPPWRQRQPTSLAARPVRDGSRDLITRRVVVLGVAAPQHGIAPDDGDELDHRRPPVVLADRLSRSAATPQ